MVIYPTQPLLPKEMMTPRSMRHTSNQPLTLHTSRADGIEAASAESPHRNAAHIQLRPACHVIEHAAPQTIGTRGVCRVRGRVGRAGDLTDNRRPAAVDDLVRALAVVGPVPVQAGHEQDGGDAVGSARFLWQTDVQRDGGSIVPGGVGVWDDFFFDGWVPQGRGFEVDLFLALEGEAFHRGVGVAGWADVGESGDAEDDCCAAEKV